MGSIEIWVSFPCCIAVLLLRSLNLSLKWLQCIKLYESSCLKKGTSRSAWLMRELAVEPWHQQLQARIIEEFRVCQGCQGWEKSLKPHQRRKLFQYFQRSTTDPAEIIQPTVDQGCMQLRCTSKAGLSPILQIHIAAATLITQYQQKLFAAKGCVRPLRGSRIGSLVKASIVPFNIQRIDRTVCIHGIDTPSQVAGA